MRVMYEPSRRKDVRNCLSTSAILRLEGGKTISLTSFRHNMFIRLMGWNKYEEASAKFSSFELPEKAERFILADPNPIRHVRLIQIKGGD